MAIDKEIAEIIVDIKYRDGESYACREFVSDIADQEDVSPGGIIMRLYRDCERLRGRNDRGC